MSLFAYLFEAKSIQDYILKGGRLRYLVGGSELIESLCQNLLSDALEALDLREAAADAVQPEPGEVVFSRRAGGAFNALLATEAEARALRDLWGLTVNRLAPELEFVHTIASGPTAPEAIRSGVQQLFHLRNRRAAPLPQATPVLALSPRTGEAAVATSRDGERIDSATVARERFRKGHALLDKFASAATWPTDLNPAPEGESDGRAFPFKGENRYIGLVHADGNGLGQLLMQLREAVQPAQYVALFRGFSEAIESATVDAARTATREVLEPAAQGETGVMPARPIVLGGDDLSIIVRSDLALDFTRVFLETFENTTREAIAGLAQDFGLRALPVQLTACAGIAFVKASQPFSTAHALAESLCIHAKSVSKARPDHGTVASCLAFHRVTTAIAQDYDTILARELTLADPDADTGRQLTLQPYFVGQFGQDRPRLDALHRLATQLGSEDMRRGPLRQLMTLLYDRPHDAEQAYARLCQNMQERAVPAWKEFKACLGGFGIVADAGLPFTRNGNLFQTPLADAMALQAAKN